MSTNQPTPVAVIGVGRMGRHHARIYHELAGADLLAVVDADEDRAATLADEYGCVALNNVEQLLDQFPNLRAVTIAVPTESHESVASQLLNQHVACLIEKPLADSIKSARSIVETARACDTLVQVGHTERFNPAVRAIAELNVVPRFIEVDRVSPMTFRSIDVGVVFDMMIHDIDIVLMLTQSPIKEIRAVGVAVLGDCEDVADARIEFANGCVAKITASRLALKTERKLRVFSESGYVSLDYAAKNGLLIQRKGNIQTLQKVRQQLADGADLSDVDYAELVELHNLTINDEEPLVAELSNFLAAVEGHAAPAVDAEAGCAAVEVAEQITAAIRSHQWDGLDSFKPV